MKRRLRWQFILPLAAFFALTFAGIDAYLSHTFITIYQSHLKDTLTAESNVIIDELQEAEGFPATITNLQSITDNFAQILDARITIIQPDGTVSSDSEALAATMENHLTRPEVQQALNGAVGYQIRLSSTLNSRMLYVAVPVMEDGRVVLIVRMARSLQSIESDVSGLNRTIFYSGVVALLLLVLITSLVFHRTTEPLARLTEAARDFPRGVTKRVKIRRHGNEIDELAVAFNTMAAQINEQIDDLKEQKNRLGNILDQMQDGVLIVDEHGVIESINPAAVKMFGTNQNEVIGQQLIQTVQYYQVSELYQQTLDTQTSHLAPIDLPQRNLSLQAISSILEEPGGKSVLLLFQDTSLQRQLDATRRDFVSNVSHELRTPLASLRALSETLQAGALDDRPAAQHFIELMEIEIAKLTQMVDELLQLSRIESGRVPLKLTDTKPIDLINESIERMELQAQRAGVTLTGTCDEHLPEVHVDSEKIEQVLVNLVHNAVKFTPPGGKIEVSASAEGKMVIFSISDTGVGIAKEDLTRVFERFYKADRARASGGTGLGLSIAKHVITNHGGRIWVESSEGRGSIFHFSVPISPTH